MVFKKILLKLPVFSVLISAGFICSAQNFTRITSVSNPIVTDVYQSGGGSWVDINNDGWLDLFVANGNLTDEKNNLYLNLGGGNFKKILVGDIVNDGGSSIGSTWADYDNDGFLDCFVTNRNFFGDFLYHGNGDTIFTKITTGTIVTDMNNSNSSSWVDINNDGFVDLYDVVFSQDDLLYMNTGGTEFLKDELNTIVNDGIHFSIPGVWGDYNNDGLPDLFRGNSGSENDAIYVNQGNSTFTEIILADGKATLGGSWADFDNDGDLDLFVANYLDNGNLYYKNEGPPDYTLTKVTTGVPAASGNCVGSAWGDIDNDGDLDLFVADDGSNNLLYYNGGPPDYNFSQVTAGAPVDDIGSSFGAVFGDYDNDGQLDLFVANHLSEENFLYHNDGNSNHWITIKCIGLTSNKSAIGTRFHIKATINGSPVWQMQEVSGQTGYNSQNLWLHFGLGTTAIIDTILVDWPSGEIDTCVNIGADEFYVATEGSCLSPVTVQEVYGDKDVIHLSVTPNPFTTKTEIAYSTTATGRVTIQIFNQAGKKIRTLVDDKENKGLHKVVFNGSDIPTGIYFCHIRSGSFTTCKKMVLIK